MICCVYCHDVALNCLFPLFLTLGTKYPTILPLLVELPVTLEDAVFKTAALNSLLENKEAIARIDQEAKTTPESNEEKSWDLFREKRALLLKLTNFGVLKSTEKIAMGALILENGEYYTGEHLDKDLIEEEISGIGVLKGKFRTSFTLDEIALFKNPGPMPREILEIEELMSDLLNIVKSADEVVVLSKTKMENARPCEMHMQFFQDFSVFMRIYNGMARNVTVYKRQVKGDYPIPIRNKKPFFCLPIRIRKSKHPLVADPIFENLTGSLSEGFQTIDYENPLLIIAKMRLFANESINVIEQPSTEELINISEEMISFTDHMVQKINRSIVEPDRRDSELLSKTKRLKEIIEIFDTKNHPTLLLNDINELILNNKAEIDSGEPVTAQKNPLLFNAIKRAYGIQHINYVSVIETEAPLLLNDIMELVVEIEKPSYQKENPEV